MPYQYIFPYYTVFLIIIVGIVVLAVDFWWSVPVVWKGFNWDEPEINPWEVEQWWLEGWEWLK